jgi:hypothetical protein
VLFSCGSLNASVRLCSVLVKSGGNYIEVSSFVLSVLRTEYCSSFFKGCVCVDPPLICFMKTLKGLHQSIEIMGVSRSSTS